MINTREFGQSLKELGFDFYSGVPCSFLKYLINYAINHCEYVMAANEGDAVATCSGAYLGGRKSVFLCQNSGLTNAVSPLTSLNHTFQIPVLGFVSLRGEVGLQDEPQHELMGRATTELLDAMEIPWDVLSADINEAKQQLLRANEIVEQGKSFFFVVKKNTFAEEKLLQQSKEAHSNFPLRSDVLQLLSQLREENTIFLATTGYSGRELYQIDDQPNNLYMVGSLGCVSSLALGLAMSRPDKKIVEIDGDGSLLMRMGSMATNGYYQPENLLHVLLDNGAHESTGGQETVSSIVDFTALAKSQSYTYSTRVSNLNELEKVFHAWQQTPALTFVHCPIRTGVMPNLGRPTVTPAEVRQRLMQQLNSNSTQLA